MKLHKFIYVLAILLILPGLFSCTHENLDGQLDETTENGDVQEFSQDAATEKALSLFPGTVEEVENEEEEGIPALKIDIEGESGAEVEIYLDASTGDLLRIDGEEGPFTYDLDPGNSLISYAEAKAIAEKQVYYPQLEEWRLRQEAEFEQAWVYTFEFENEEISIDGESGKVLETDN